MKDDLCDTTKTHKFNILTEEMSTKLDSEK